MRIIECDGWFLGVDQRDAVWFRPDTEEEKTILKDFVKKIRDVNPMELYSGEDVALTNY